jgi:hypothetical protein
MKGFLVEIKNYSLVGVLLIMLMMEVRGFEKRNSHSVMSNGETETRRDLLETQVCEQIHVFDYLNFPS